MSRVIDMNGAQILPPVGDEKATVTMWEAQQCVSADHRAKHPVFVNLAETLTVTT